jgi:hypothetical protein
MNWLSVVDLTRLAVCKLTHRIIKTGKPDLLAELMTTPNPNNHNTTQSLTNTKLGPAPRQLGQTNTTKFNFRNKAHTMYNNLPGTITALPSKILFAKWVKRYLKDNNHTPQDLTSTTAP